ncbi:MAG: hypothetical protein HUU50_02375 [Candidatus Brocadiae bacterium]|nr:hypothetical protein [Candidatus Brocadiia bacterium]
MDTKTRFFLRLVPVSIILVFLLLKIFSSFGSFFLEEKKDEWKVFPPPNVEYKIIHELGHKRFKCNKCNKISKYANCLCTSVSTTSHEALKVPEPLQPIKAPMSDGIYTLQGIVVDGLKQKVYFYNKEKNETIKLGLGENLQNYKIAEITSNGVRFEGWDKWFYLFRKQEEYDKNSSNPIELKINESR